MLDGYDAATDNQNEFGAKNVIKRHLFDDVHGFDDEDLEKPNFPRKQSSEKVPLVLSDVDNPPVVQVPATINQYLREYQREGIAFLYRQYSSGNGAILADDMGLGKTVQVIGFMSAVLGKTGTKLDVYGKFLSETDKNKDPLNEVKKEKGAFLIVSPNSVLYNWHDELMTWGYFKIGKFHKNKRDETIQKASLGRLEVVLTTYETLRNHWETLNSINWLAVIMDEVHHLKDPKRAVTIASKALNVTCRIGLTGTPLQNRLLDFWSVLDWANPGCLGDKNYFTYGFGRPIMQGQRFDGTKREIATGRKKTQEFQSIIDDWCLRRTKTLIADQLPQKDQKVVFCPLSKLQEDIYKTLLQTNDVQLVLKQAEPCDCRSGLTRGMCCYMVNEEGSNMKKLLLQCLRLFLKVSNHAALLLPHVKQTDDQRKRAKAICERVFAVHQEFEAASRSPSFELFSDSNFCGKMKVLDKLLKLFKQQKDKVLLFSYSTQLLDMLEAYVISCGMVYRRLDGKTRGERRLDIVREFNTNPEIFVFLVSTKAGGVGLNLTSANIVIVFDPSWNPADDLQAEDRAYRIGQRRDVKVFRLIASGTVEENMYLRQIYKQQLANVAVEGNNERRYFTAVDGEKDKKGELFGIENLFALRNDSCSVSTDIFKRSDHIERGFRMAKYELNPKEEPKTIMIGEQSTTSVQRIETEVEENSYNLDEITSQFIDHETNMDSDLCNKPTEDHCRMNEKQETTFTKVLDISKKPEKLEKRLPQSNCDEKQKRQKMKQKRPISKDSQVNQILEECGIQHTHSNKLIIGTSEAENEMTSRAIKDVFDLGQYSQQPANCFAAVESDSEESDDIGEHVEPKPHDAKTEEKDKFEEPKDCNFSVTDKVQRKFSMKSKADGRTILFGETPKTIRLRQFMEISRAHGYESEVEFARAVISGNTTEYQSMLIGYYEEKEYPSDCILAYSQTIQSSPDLNTGKSKENKRITRKKDSALPARKKSTQKSFTKVRKPLLIKRNRTDRFAKKPCKYLKLKTQSTKTNEIESNTVVEASGKLQQNTDSIKSLDSSVFEATSSKSLVNRADESFIDVTDNLQEENDSTKLGNSLVEAKSCISPEIEDRLGRNTTGYDYEKTNCFDDSLVEPMSRTSPAGTDQACEDILIDILNACSESNSGKIQDGTTHNSSTLSTPLLQNRAHDSQSSSFLDEILSECTQSTHNRRRDTPEFDVNTENCKGIQTSFIDDLI